MPSVHYLLSPIFEQNAKTTKRIVIDGLLSIEIFSYAKQNAMMHEFRHSEQRTMKRCCLLI